MAATALKSAVTFWSSYEEDARRPDRAPANTDATSPVHALWARIEQQYLDPPAAHAADA